MDKTVYDRTRMLLGEGKMDNLKKKSIIIFGVGGVGGFVIESLGRIGIGNLTVVDFDKVDITNINRQIVALQSTIGELKTDVIKRRLDDINPEICVRAISKQVTKENVSEFSFEDYDYVVDAIDDVEAKIALITQAKLKNIPIICSMGTGNKIDPLQFKIADIQKTHSCPLAKVMRKRLGTMGIKDVKVLFSTEAPHREETPKEGRISPASISYMPAVAGLLLTSEIIKDLLERDN